jgi:hypothetical protein
MAVQFQRELATRFKGGIHVSSGDSEIPDITVRGYMKALYEAEAHIKVLEDDDNGAQIKALVEVAKATVDEARSNLQNAGHIRSGDLHESIGILKVDKPGLSVTIGSPLPQAHYIEDGRGEVRPVTRKFLRFTLPDGTIVFTKRAKAFHADPYMRPAVDNQSGKFAYIYAERVSEQVGHIPDEVIDL